MKKILIITFLLTAFNSCYRVPSAPQAKEFPVFLQLEVQDCGASCLKMIAKYYDKEYDIKYLYEITKTDKKEGVSLLNLSDGAEAIGFNTLSAKTNFEKLKTVPLPCIVHWRQQHFIVVYAIKNQTVFAVDPAVGKVEFTEKEFCDAWYNKTGEGVLMLLELK
jgi:ATP-binding cassette, subfamily B, bacterial